MKIAILILLFYSLFGVHVTFTLGHFKGYTITMSTDKIVSLVALVLYCIYVFQGVDNARTFNSDFNTLVFRWSAWVFP